MSFGNDWANTIVLTVRQQELLNEADKARLAKELKNEDEAVRHRKLRINNDKSR